MERPLLEPFGLCGAWAQYGFGQSAVLGLDLPVYLVATILHSALTAQPSCVDALTTPRGHVVTATLAFPIWFLAGLGLRRFGLEAWRSPARSASLRGALYLVLPVGALGCLLLVFGAATQLAEDAGFSVRLLGLGFWFAWAGALAAERLRVWPFDKLKEESPI